MSNLSIFSLKFTPIYLNYNLPPEIIKLIMDYFKMIHLTNSKMFIIKKNNILLNCSHYINRIYYTCPNHHQDKHYHCGRCGKILDNNHKMKKALKSIYKQTLVYPYKQSCNQLLSHHIFYTIP
jgi:hypothetical protein